MPPCNLQDVAPTITRKAMRSAFTQLRTVQYLVDHPFAALHCVEIQRMAAGHPPAYLGRGLALRDPLQTAIESLKPDNHAVVPTVKRCRSYVIAYEHYRTGRNLRDLQRQEDA